MDANSDKHSNHESEEYHRMSVKMAGSWVVGRRPVRKACVDGREIVLSEPLTLLDTRNEPLLQNRLNRVPSKFMSESMMNPIENISATILKKTAVGKTLCIDGARTKDDLNTELCD